MDRERKLRDALNLRARITGPVPCERQVRDRLFCFYDWCAQNDDIPELVSLARTVFRWEDEIVAAVITGITNATAESLNRLANLEARLAYGFRNPRNQQRRVRIACTRGCRRRSRTATIIRTRTVTGRKPRPGYCNLEEPENRTWQQQSLFRRVDSVAFVQNFMAPDQPSRPGLRVKGVRKLTLLVCEANEIPGSQTGSQRTKTPGNVSRR